MKWSQATEVGRVRQQNEDSVLAAADIGLFAVADGMGGHRAGEVASNMAMRDLEQYIRKSGGGDMGRILVDAVRNANSNVFSSSGGEPSLKGMGTTLTAVVLKDGKATVSHVGDSRAYLIRGTNISQLTRDHSLVQELFNVGGITRAEAREHPQRNVLTRALGTGPVVDVDLVNLKLKTGDVLLLCTDGLTGLVEDHEILTVYGQSHSLDDAVHKLIRTAMDRGGNDNISVVLIAP